MRRKQKVCISQVVVCVLLESYVADWILEKEEVVIRTFCKVGLILNIMDQQRFHVQKIDRKNTNNFLAKEF